MSGALAVYGAIGGALVCAAAGMIGARAVFAAAVNGEQRQVLRQIFFWGGAYVAAVNGIVVLAALQVLAPWAYAAALVLWFGPMLPALAWAHQRLDAAAGATSLSVSLSVA